MQNSNKKIKNVSGHHRRLSFEEGNFEFLNFK